MVEVGPRTTTPLTADPSVNPRPKPKPRVKSSALVQPDGTDPNEHVIPTGSVPSPIIDATTFGIVGMGGGASEAVGALGEPPGSIARELVSGVAAGLVSTPGGDVSGANPSSNSVVAVAALLDGAIDQLQSSVSQVRGFLWI